MGFSWPRSVAIAAVIALHASFFLMITSPSTRFPDHAGSRPLLWDEYERLPVMLEKSRATPERVPAEIRRLAPTDLRTTASSEAASSSSSPEGGERGVALHADLPDEWSRPTETRFDAWNPMTTGSPIDYTPTRFAHAWAPEGDAMDQLAFRSRAVSILRAAMGYQRPCTDEEIRRRLPRCFPPGAEPDN